MNQIKFECQVLTPLFLGGADSRLNPELRAPSIRGAMRYWYRALLGGSTLVNKEIDELRTLRDSEARVFGTTEQNSRVTVRVAYDAEPDLASFQKDRAIRTPDGRFLPTGKDYLLWSMAATRQLPDREYIKPDTKFVVTLGALWDARALKEATAAFWLLGNLGGLGARSNRGAGSIQVQRLNQSDEMVFQVSKSVDELESYLANGVRQCLNALDEGDAQWRSFKDERSPYDVITPDAVKIWVVADAQGGWNSFSSALNGIGEKMRDFRSHRNPVGRADHDAVLKWLEEGGSPPQIKRAAFGLPIPFRYSDGGPGDVVQAEGSERRASPLRIRVTRLTTGKYVGVITLFESRFLDEGKILMLQTRKRKAPAPTNYEVIEDFIETFELKRRVEL